MSLHHCLKCIASGQVYLLDKPTLLLGRSESCEICIPVKSLSREHAMVMVADERIVIKDLQSTNGTFVNSMRIHVPTDLQHGDVVTLGDEKLVLIAPDTFEEIASAEHRIGEELDPFDNTSSRTMFKSSYLADVDWPFSTPMRSTTTGTFKAAAERTLQAKKIDRRRVPAVLVFKSGQHEGRIIELKLPFGAEMQWSIGRNSLSDVVLEDPTVSGHHAVIQCVDDQWELLDNQSTNGIKLNGKPVQHAVCHDSDVITVGAVTFLLRLL